MDTANRSIRHLGSCDMSKVLETDDRPPTTWRLLSRDDVGITWLVILFLSPLVAFLLVMKIIPDLVGPLLGRTALMFTATVVVLLTVLGAVGGLSLRVRRLKHLFRHGLRLKAEVLEITECGRGVVLADFEYFVEDKRYAAVSPPLSIRGLTRGETIEILLDPKNHRVLLSRDSF